MNTTDTTENLCIDCGGNEIIEDEKNGSIVCITCGSVQDDHIINECDEGKNYENSMGVRKNQSRHGHYNEFNPYDSLGTYIPKDTYILITRSDGTTYRADLSKLNMMVSQNGKERSYNNTVKIFDNLEFNQDIHKSVIDNSKRIWAEISKSNDIIYRGSNRNGILACCILYSSYSTERPLDRTTLCKIMNIDKRDLSHGEPLFKNLIKDTVFKDILNYSLKDRSLNKFSKYVSDLNLDYSIVNECTNLYNTINIKSLKEKSIISGILWYIIVKNKLEDKITKKELSTVTNVTIPTLNKSFQKINEYFEMEK